MALLREIVAELDRLLDPAGFSDHCPNGLQVEGSAQVTHVATGVSATLELFEQAIEAGAELIVTHHGLFWDGDDPRVLGPRRERLRMLLAADVSLVSYHLPLDAHPVLGNNALIAQGLGLVDPEPFGLHRGRAIGVRARTPNGGLTPAELVSRVGELTSREPLAFLEGPPSIGSVGIVSGGGARSVQEAIASGLDAFITGEPAEWARAVSREAGIHFLAAGHHATETFGPLALGRHLEHRFAVRHSDVPISNPV